jgi:hypothetical protein
MLRPGIRVYTANDGGDHPERTTILRTRRAFFSHDPVADNQVLYVRPGTPAIVTEIIYGPNAYPDWNIFHSPIVKLKGVDKPWQGYAFLVKIQPSIPAGTIMTMTAKEDPLTISPCPQDFCAARERIIGDKVRVKLLRYHPEESGLSLFVKVLDGEYRGTTGWMDLQETKEAEDSLEQYVWHYPGPAF